MVKKVLIGGVTLVVVAVIALIAWVAFRPLLSGDYSVTSGYVERIGVLNETPLVAMVASVGQPVDGQAADQLENRITNTVGQVDVLLESVDEALGTRAGTRDDEVHEQLTALRDAYTNLKEALETVQADRYPQVAWVASACTGDVAGGQHCESAVAEAPDSVQDENLDAVLAAGRSVAEGTAPPSAILEPLEGWTEHVGSLWEPIEQHHEAVTATLAEHE
ncbi:hypothetical protein [Aeromicrobium sp. CTD01-1L150]|uniref:hypothetical protein n=1 Tax=Aeromicrobium sp. CTD01-1L150 TaxID=3341830 RepID=UPI0035C01C36